MRNIMLRSVAAATLVLSPVLAVAQGPGAGGERGAAPERGSGAERQGEMRQGGEGGKMAPNGAGARQEGGPRENGAAPTAEKPAEKPANENRKREGEGRMQGEKPGAEKNMGEKNMGSEKGGEHERRGAERDKGERGGGEQRGGEKARATSSKTVTTEQRTKIRSIIRTQHVENITHVNFSITVGTAIPASYQFYPLPPEIIEIVPQYAGFDYILVNDEVIIIDPGARTIVYVID